MYESPTIRVLGSIHELTEGSASGAYLDKDYSAGTPFKDLTFSG